MTASFSIIQNISKHFTTEFFIT